MKTDTKRVSITKKVTRRVSALLLAALAVLLVCSFFLVCNFVKKKTISMNKAIVSFYGDVISFFCSNNDIPLDTEHPEYAVLVGNYLCEWYDIDYAYMYIPGIESGKRTFINIIENPQFIDEEIDENYMNGYVIERPFSDEEKAVWNGEKLFGVIHTNNSFGNELSVIYRVDDLDGKPCAIAGVDTSLGRIYVQIASMTLLFALIFAAVIIAVHFAVRAIIRKEVSRPAGRLCRSMNEYLADGTHTSIETGKNTSAEYAEIAEAFDVMTKNIDNYVKSIDELNTARVQSQTELGIASDIQQGLLPASVFVGKACELHARMVPAKDVGGDLYDYLPLDEHRTLVVIADVSGKGVSGAFFMAVSLVLIRQYAKMGLSPAEILTRTNDSLCSNNPAMLFVTAFVGIYDGETRTLTFSNAGHNPPYIVGNTLRTLDTDPCPMLGLFEGETYTESTSPMAIGETVFLYTDGVNEATDGMGTFFGEKRLEEALVRCRKTHKEDPVNYIYDTVKSFAGDAEQHDDITMLTLTSAETKELDLNYDIAEFSKIKDAILSLTLSRGRQLDLCLAAEECFVNICSYAFEGGAPDGENIHVTLIVSDRITMRFEDGGVPFDPLSHADAPEDYDIDTQIGGLGTFIAFSSVDDAKYEYKNKKNVLTLIKYFEEDDDS